MKMIILIAGKELGDRLRSGWVVACVLVWLGTILFTSLFGLLQMGQIGWQGYERTVASLLNLVQYLVPLLGLLLGHDLITHEREERTLALVLAGGVSRTRLLLGKWFGGVLTLGIPLVLGFGLAGTLIGLSTQAGALGPFIRLAVSGLLLGIVFLSLGLLISTLCHTRVKALVMALLTWGFAVFAFDLAALGLLVTTQAKAAVQEIEMSCEATHVNLTADPHQDFDPTAGPTTPRLSKSDTHFLAWLLLNPVDTFRLLNLPAQTAPAALAPAAVAALLLWLGTLLEVSAWRFRRSDV